MHRLLAFLVLFIAAPVLGQPVFLQQLADPNPTSGSRFGTAVALGGDYIVVGEPGEAGAAGRAFAFFRAPGASTWAFDEELVPSSLTGGGEFEPAYGSAVAFDEATALVGAPYESGEVINSGAAYVFQRDEATNDWADAAKLKAPTPDLEDQFGAAVALSGATAAVGAFDDDEAGQNAGAVYLFSRDAESGAWSFAQQLVAEDPEPGDRFGFSVALQEDVLVVGTFNEIVPDDPGAVYVFERSGDAAPWVQVQKLIPDGVEPNERFGFAVAVDGETLFAGAPLAGSGEEGAAYVYERTGEGEDPWELAQRLISVAPQENAQFGAAVSVDGDRAAIGAPLDGTGVSSGAVYTFERSNGVWSPANRLSADMPEESALFGHAVALRSGLTVVGSPDADVGADDTGAAYVFSLMATATGSDAAPDGFGLGAPYPNPARSSVALTYTLPGASDVTLAVFDVLGREVAVLDAGPRPAGLATVRWDTRGLPAGVYIIRLVSADRIATRNVLVVR